SNQATICSRLISSIGVASNVAEARRDGCQAFWVCARQSAFLKWKYSVAMSPSDRVGTARTGFLRVAGSNATGEGFPGFLCLLPGLRERDQRVSSQTQRTRLACPPPGEFPRMRNARMAHQRESGAIVPPPGDTSLDAGFHLQRREPVLVAPSRMHAPYACK